MQRAICQTRAAAAAFQPAKPAKRQQARRQQRLQPLAVAAMEEPVVAEEAPEEPEWDRNAAYARFEQLLDTHNFDFHTGDKASSG
jgi:hypothetical protein